jgi:hypothetical protein
MPPLPNVWTKAGPENKKECLGVPEAERLNWILDLAGPLDKLWLLRCWQKPGPHRETGRLQNLKLGGEFYMPEPLHLRGDPGTT